MGPVDPGRHARQAPVSASGLRLGIDLGGTKIAGIVLDRDDRVIVEARVASPRSGYDPTIAALVAMIANLEQRAQATCSVGIGIPGALSPTTGLVQNANSTWLNAQPLQRDLEAASGRVLRFANDANCFALSEVHDGAARGARIAFGVILGTGCGGGVVIDGRVLDGPRGIGGEWGHTPLPWPTPDELATGACWCGRAGCLEDWVSGTGLAADHARVTGETLSCEDIATAARHGEAAAIATLDRHVGRLARGLAAVTNILDPDVIVLGGGLSALPHLYAQLPGRMAPYIFADTPLVTVLPPRWGDASGVRGAARLWP
jgi:fructokinase